MSKKEHNMWYKDAIIYQLHVQSFFDSNGDGIGDFKGLMSKLDYCQSLGVNALWLLPFYPSPLRDGGYDISDFTGIHNNYGSMADFKRFIREAHKRNLKVITELVLNHTSNEHKWFKRAKNARKNTSFRNFYVWNDTPDKYIEARIIFKDFETSNWSYDPVAGAYYWHRFYSHQPDLNFENPAVQKAIFKVLDFWFDAGVDGLRLDAVPYLYEKEGTNCENLPETHGFLKKLRAYIDSKYQNRMLLAEANQWPEDASEYFGKGDECHMAFHFPVMPRLFMGVRMEDRFPIIDILEQTPDIPDNCQWATFLRNHDELTLEMVTDEERDYMYKSFAKEPEQRINLGIRRRLAPLMDADRRKIEMMNILLFSLPGTPIVYYGDELGMGDNYYLGDRNGVRTPMQWTSDKNAGFSSGSPQRLYLPVIIEPEYHYESINVESQDKNPSSLLWWMRRVIAMRKKFKAFSRGNIKFINSNNPKVLSFVREYEDEIILVLVNLSRYTQITELELEDYEGYIPREIFSRNDFPEIEDTPYMVPLKLKDYYWFQLNKPEEDDYARSMELEYNIWLKQRGWNVLSQEVRGHLEEEIIQNYLQTSRWFRGKAQKVRAIQIFDYFITSKIDALNSYILFIEIDYVEQASENYVLPVSIIKGEEVADVRHDHPTAIIAKLHIDEEEAVIVDSTIFEHFHKELLEMMTKRKKLKGQQGTITGEPAKDLRDAVRKKELPDHSKIVIAEQSNSSILYGEQFFLKIYRAPEEGYNPEVEILRNLTEKTNFRNFPSFAGKIEYQNGRSEPLSIGLLTGFIPNEGNAWEFTKTNIQQYFDRIYTHKGEITAPDYSDISIYESFGEKALQQLKDLTGHFFTDMVWLLGERTAELHKSLVTITDDNDFKPEPFSLLYQKSVYQSIRTLVRRTINDLKTKKRLIPEYLKDELDLLFTKEKEILQYINDVLTKEKIRSVKARIHGDYHLGQVLFTGKDFIIIDFEGEPARSISARKLKYCPLKDVAGMLRSLHYAIYMEFFDKIADREEDKEFLSPWLESWYKNISNNYIKAYLKSSDGVGYIPETQEELEGLLNVYLIEKAVYEIGYEMNNRPDWSVIPLRGLINIINQINHK
jgi:maltose alpha-D-glucosyltransferase/alpha-amylase